MQSAKCRICGQPVTDMYGPTDLCTVHQKQKSNLLHVQTISRVLAILVSIPLLIGIILSLIQINSGLTTYFFVLWQATVLIIALSILYITTSKMRRYYQK
jgi:uncharacterized membrane protein